MEFQLPTQLLQPLSNWKSILKKGHQTHVRQGGSKSPFELFICSTAIPPLYRQFHTLHLYIHFLRVHRLRTSTFTDMRPTKVQTDVATTDPNEDSVSTPTPDESILLRRESTKAEWMDGESHSGEGVFISPVPRPQLHLTSERARPLEHQSREWTRD